MAMLGTKENPVESGKFWFGSGTYEGVEQHTRFKLPHGWLVQVKNTVAPEGSGVTFVPFTRQDGIGRTGWGKNDPAGLVDI